MKDFSSVKPVRFGVALAVTVLLAGGAYFASPAEKTDSPSAVVQAQTVPLQPSVQPVNAVVGDESYRLTYGEAPTAETSELRRLQTHLAYVEGLLRAKDAGHLTPAQRARRAKLLDELRTYWKRGLFPKNTYQSGRTPVFIDEEGRLCAVGYLIAQSAGREAAERVNERFQLARIADMDAPRVEKWARRHGFTLRELAMIQPTYGCPGGLGCVEPEDTSENMHKGIEGASIGLSASAALLNGYLIGTDRRSRVAAGAGLVTGGASLAIGLSGKANYAPADYALAGASLLVSGWNLLRPGSDGGGEEEDASSDDPAVVRSDASPAPRVRPALLPTGANDYAPGVHVSWRF